MNGSTQIIGKKGEDLAEKYLQNKGYTIIERNYRSKLGEIDIIAMDENTTVFVEVKTRKSNKYGQPKESVNRSKQKKLSINALLYLKQKKALNKKARFDVISINNHNKSPKIELIQNAFELTYK